MYKYWYVTGEAIWQVTTEFHTLSRKKETVVSTCENRMPFVVFILVEYFHEWNENKVANIQSVYNYSVGVTFF